MAKVSFDVGHRGFGRKVQSIEKLPGRNTGEDGVISRRPEVST